MGFYVVEDVADVEWLGAVDSRTLEGILKLWGGIHLLGVMGLAELVDPFFPSAV